MGLGCRGPSSLGTVIYVDSGGFWACVSYRQRAATEVLA